MFVSARGTSGSGKTTLARIVLDGEGIYGPKKGHFVKDRKRPLYYTRQPVGGEPARPIAILGSYESPTGGADTISSNQMPFDLFYELNDRGYDVFCEGLLHSAEQHRTAKLHTDGHDVRLFYFDLPLQTCLDGVQARRTARGNTKPLNPETTSSRHRTLRLHPARFLDKGVKVTIGDRKKGVQWLVDIGLAHADDNHVKYLLSL